MSAVSSRLFAYLDTVVSHTWTALRGGSIFGTSTNSTNVVLHSSDGSFIGVRAFDNTNLRATNGGFILGAPGAGTTNVVDGNGLFYGTLTQDVSNKTNAVVQSVNLPAVTNVALVTTNRPFILTNDFVLNQYYTNTISRAWVYSSWTLQAGATDAAQLSIFIDRDGDGIPDATGHTILQGVALTTANIYELSRMIPARAAFVFTNQSGATAATPVVVKASCQWAND